MWNRITRAYKDILDSIAMHLMYLFFGTFVYFMVANTVFAFRHPWATDMERFIHVGDALMFKKVSYKEMRGSYDKE